MGEPVSAPRLPELPTKVLPLAPNLLAMRTCAAVTMAHFLCQ